MATWAHVGYAFRPFLSSYKPNTGTISKTLLHPTYICKYTLNYCKKGIRVRRNYATKPNGNFSILYITQALYKHGLSTSGLWYISTTGFSFLVE